MEFFSQGPSLVADKFFRSRRTFASRDDSRLGRVLVDADADADANANADADAKLFFRWETISTAEHLQFAARGVGLPFI